jgi:hypothetical protein
MPWKITELPKNPDWLAVLSSHYDKAFVTDIKTLPKAKRRFNEHLQAWLVHRSCRPQLELILAKHSPPPRVELAWGLEGVDQLFDFTQRLGRRLPDEDMTLRQGHELALECAEDCTVDFEDLRTMTVEVEGHLVHLMVVPRIDDEATDEPRSR